MQDQKLMDHFNFTEADLQANRKGQFSDAQKKRITSDQTSSFHSEGWLVGCTFPASVIMLGWMTYSIYKDVTTQDTSNLGLVINLGIWGFIALVVALFALRAMFVRHQFKLGKVQGPINIVREVVHGEHGHTSTYHELHVGGEEFDVDEGLGNVMMQGDVYAIYYKMDNNNAGDVLSAELISKAK